MFRFVVSDCVPIRFVNSDAVLDVFQGSSLLQLLVCDLSSRFFESLLDRKWDEWVWCYTEEQCGSHIRQSLQQAALRVINSEGNHFLHQAASHWRNFRWLHDADQVMDICLPLFLTELAVALIVSFSAFLNECLMMRFGSANGCDHLSLSFIRSMNRFHDLALVTSISSTQNREQKNVRSGDKAVSMNDAQMSSSMFSLERITCSNCIHYDVCCTETSDRQSLAAFCQTLSESTQRPACTCTRRPVVSSLDPLHHPSSLNKNKDRSCAQNVVCYIKLMILIPLLFTSGLVISFPCFSFYPQDITCFAPPAFGAAVFVSIPFA